MGKASNIVFLISTCVVLGLFATSCIGICWGRINADLEGKNVHGKLKAFTLVHLMPSLKLRVHCKKVWLSQTPVSKK